ncbi:TPA: galactose-1-phosphate uridylyltransferase [Candidatus Bathyarchaeota archaeon]|nr:galactose-1-phosphate uridylyltransferase [Candidatus Bathyarchaeota archaeon]
MLHNELRKDFLLSRWVVIATERSRRPTDFTKQRDPNSETRPAVCPMCPGNEHMTPPAVLVYLKSNGQIVRKKDLDGFRHKDWLLRVVPNLFPAFSPPESESEKQEIMKSDVFGLAVGHHEVLVESPIHDAHPADTELSQLVNVINAYIERTRELTEKPYVKHVSIFRNHGQLAGASLSHAHSQLIAMPFVPSTVVSEIASSKNYWSKNQKCIFCDLVGKESSGSRFVQGNSDFVAITPYASVYPMEFWIVPKKHAMNPLKLTQEEKKTFAQILKSILNALKSLVNDPPYNYGIHLSVDKRVQDCYHWHLEVFPKLSIWAGFEKSTGVYINTIPPETAAAELRKTLAS